MFLNKRYFLAYIISFFILFIALIMGISFGTVHIPFLQVIQILLSEWLRIDVGSNIDPLIVNIVVNIRMPRVMLALLVGASLAVSGGAFQGLLKNPLADPYTLGVSSGASVGAVFVLFFGISLPWLGSFTLPMVSIICAFVTLILVLSFAQMVQRAMTVETIILTGIIFGSFLGSLLSLMIALTGDQLREIITWLLGSVSMRGWEYVSLIFPFFVFGGLYLMMNGRELNTLAFGEETAQHLGVDVAKKKLLILAAASLLTGAGVAVSGIIGFVGLVIPHVTRLLWGPDHRHLLPLSMVNGGAFLIIADLTARTIIAPTELPIGIITSLIGAPVFGVILYQQRRRKEAQHD